MNSKKDDILLKTTHVTEWTWNHGGYIAISFGAFLLAGCISAYIIAVIRGNVDPFLPLISDAAGSPPQNGLFGTLICIGGMLGVVFMFLRYMIVLEKNREKSKMVTFLNKLSFGIGIVSMFGITLVTGYPINFYRNRDVWLMDVGIPHMIGGITLFSFGLVYIAIQCVLTLFLKTKHRSILFIRTGICIICTAAFVYHLVTVPDNFGGISTAYFSNSSDDILPNDTTLSFFPKTLESSLKLPIDTSGSYVSSAVTEWILVFFFCCFFFTFFGEAQQYSLLIVIETHNSEADRMNEAESNGVKKSIKPNLVNSEKNGSSELSQKDVRKFLRRDSTCQTTSDTENDIVSSKPTFTSFESGKTKRKPSEQLDFFTGERLQKIIENQMRKKSKSHKNEDKKQSQETSTDDGIRILNINSTNSATQVQEIITAKDEPVTKETAVETNHANHNDQENKLSKNENGKEPSLPQVEVAS